MRNLIWREPHWDVHDHKDELQVSWSATIFHLARGQLCRGERRGATMLYHPIQWPSRPQAEAWRASGTIAELQESFSNLNIGFSRVTMSNDRCPMCGKELGCSLCEVGCQNCGWNL